MLANKLKIFLKDYGLYLVPLASSFFYFWKVSEISFWFDELVTLSTVHKTSFINFVKNYFENQLHPPLYFFALKIFYEITNLLMNCAIVLWMSSTVIYNSFKSLLSFAGFSDAIFSHTFVTYFNNNIIYNLNQMNEFTLRFISGLSMTAMNVYIFRFFKKNDLVLLGIFVSLILGINDQIIYYAQDARPYALMTFISLMVFVEFYQSYKKEITLKNFKVLMLLNLLMLLTHYFAIFIIQAQIVILALNNLKQKRIWIGLVCYFILMTMMLSFAYEFYNLREKIPIITNFEIKYLINIAKTFFSNIEIKLILAMIFVTTAIKIIFKIDSKLDKILTNTVIFAGIIMAIYFLTSLWWPIYYLRYVMPLAPLFIIIYCGFLFSFSESVFFFIKNKKIQKLTSTAVFILFAAFVCWKQYINTFVITNYYKNQKYYYIEDAYKNILLDEEYQEKSFYILEEHVPLYFNYFENKYKLQKLVGLSPRTSLEKKEQTVNSIALKRTDLKTIYYIQVLHSDSASQQGLIRINNYSSQVLLSKENIRLFKFTLNN